MSGNRAPAYNIRSVRSVKSGRTQKSGRRWPKILRRTAVGLLVLAFLLNGILWIMYRDRVLPNYSIGSLDISGTTYANLANEIDEGTVLPERVTISAQQARAESTPSELGISVDVDKSEQQVLDSRSFFVLPALFTQTTIAAQLHINQSTFDQTIQQLAKELYTEPLAEHIVFNDDSFTTALPAEGYQVDPAQLAVDLQKVIAKGQDTLQASITTLPPPDGAMDIAAEQQRLQAQLSTPIIFVLNGQEQAIQTTDKGAWYERAGQTMQPSQNLITAYVKKTTQDKGGVSNATDVALAVLDAFNIAQESRIVVAPANAPIQMTYCVDARGVDTGKLARFSQRVAAILADPRGWNMDGQIAFQQVAENCASTIWLAAPAQMTSFGAICDEYYSCRVGPNVVINYDRWTTATEPWTNAGQNITDYQALVVNHEVGHNLGFGHPPCTGPGQPAPVMMQQSIDLGGCVFNPWPVESEKRVLKQIHDLAMSPGRRDELIATSSCGCANCTRS